MKPLEEITKKVIEFRDERNWKQFHNPKDLSLSLVLEATEFMEHFQWKNEKEVEEHIKNNKGEVSEELVDVLYWVLLISHDLDIDILDSLEKKIELNKQKYPVEKSKDNHLKYTDL